MKFTLGCGCGGICYMCHWMSKVCTKKEKILRGNPVMSLVLGQIGVITICSKKKYVDMCNFFG